MFTDEEVEVLRHELNWTMTENKASNKCHIIREPGSEEVRPIFDVQNNTDFFQRVEIAIYLAHENAWRNLQAFSCV
jgi:hypothetical protein